MSAPLQYRGWSVGCTVTPIPVRDFDWIATSPDFDADCDQDGFFICSGQQVHASSFEALCAEIDEAELERLAA
jgi:hypothetical protein